MSLNVNWINLFIKMFQSSHDSLSNTFQDNFINIVNISFPCWAFFVSFNCIMNFLQKFLDSNTIFFDVLLSVLENSFMNHIIIIRRKWSIFSFKDFLINGFKAFLNFFNTFFHFFDNFES